jgi:pimeloyl-ACP methyl ester carboxylesterase
MWGPQIEALKGDYRILAYDTRGHGGSEAPPGPYTLELLADDLHALLGALGVERAHFCGLSMGGMIGQTYALKYPGRLRSLTLADTTSRYPAEAAAVWAQRIEVALTQGMGPLAEPTLQRWFTPAFHARCPEVVGAVRQLILATPVAGYVGCRPSRRSTSPRACTRSTAPFSSSAAPTIRARRCRCPRRSTPTRPARAWWSCPRRHTWRTWSNPRPSPRRCASSCTCGLEGLGRRGHARWPRPAVSARR